MANNKDSYEELTKELEAIVVKLQDEATSIDEALSLYEKGKAITTKLEQYLQSAKNKLVSIKDDSK